MVDICAVLYAKRRANSNLRGRATYAIRRRLMRDSGDHGGDPSATTAATHRDQPTAGRTIQTRQTIP